MSPRSRPTGQSARDILLEGAWLLARPLIREIEDQLDRSLPAGDLLILLASVTGGVVTTALSSLGADADALSQAVDEARRDGARSELLWPAELVAPSDEARAAREDAAELERLAERRDEPAGTADRGDRRVAPSARFAADQRERAAPRG